MAEPTPVRAFLPLLVCDSCKEEMKGTFPGCYACKDEQVCDLCDPRPTMLAPLMPSLFYETISYPLASYNDLMKEVDDYNKAIAVEFSRTCNSTVRDPPPLRVRDESDSGPPPLIPCEKETIETYCRRAYCQFPNEVRYRSDDETIAEMYPPNPTLNRF